MNITRRDLVKIGATATLCSVSPRIARAARRIPVALQLYSLREDCAKDLDGTLKQVAGLGFSGVEFAGYYKYAKDPQGLRKKLGELKLRVAGTHIRADAFAPDKIKETIAFHKTLGCKFLIVGGDYRFHHPEKSKAYATLLTRAAAALNPEGLFCGHHNHTKEFQKDGDKTYWDLFAERTSRDVILQQDVGWSTVAGLDPAALVRKHPGRTRSTHFKAKLPEGTQGKKPFIGQDTIDWKNLITACDEAGGTEWFIVEQEDYPDGMTPLSCVKQSFQGLKKILAEMRRG